jgi:hypothetical protein
MPTLDPTPIWDEDFATRSVTIVNLHGKGDYDAAKDAASEGWEILLEREPDNESNCTAKTILGYIEKEGSPELAEQLSLGAPLHAKASGRPYSGAGARGGSLDVLVFLEGQDPSE